MGRETIEYSLVRLQFDGPLAILTLNDPARLNALNTEMGTSVAQAVAEIRKPRRRCRAMLLTGEGRAFCAGVNLMGTRKAVEAGTHKLDAITSLEATFNPVLRHLHMLPIPVVAAVNGLAIGIGMGLAMTGDFILASDRAYFQAPFKNLASAPDSGLTWLLPRLIGMQRAKRMLMRAEKVDAATALDWGLIAESVPHEQFAERAYAVAVEFANDATLALREIKQLMFDGLRSDLNTALEAEVTAIARTTRTKDNLAAVKLFASKELATFTGE